MYIEIHKLEIKSISMEILLISSLCICMYTVYVCVRNHYRGSERYILFLVYEVEQSNVHFHCTYLSLEELYTYILYLCGKHLLTISECFVGRLIVADL